MSRDKKLIDLEDLSGTEEEVVEVQQEPEVRDDISTILHRITTKKAEKPVKTQISIYLDDDVYKKYQRFGRKVGKGGRSQLVNDLLREALKDY